MARTKDNSGSRTDHAPEDMRTAAVQKPRLIATPHHLHTANLLREWADRAERGELLGVVVGAMDKDMRPRLVTGGILSNRSRDAFWVASLLQKTLLIRSQDEL